MEHNALGVRLQITETGRSMAIKRFEYMDYFVQDENRRLDNKELQEMMQ